MMHADAGGHPPPQPPPRGDQTGMAEQKNYPRVLNQQSAKKLLEEHDWVETLGGKHVVKMTKAGHRPITLPHHGRVPNPRSTAPRWQ